MLAQRYRFHGRRSIQLVFKHGDTLKTGHMIVRFQKNVRRRDSRAAVVVSKKVAKKAHDRNRIRRRMYETLRTQWQTIPGSYDLVYIVSSHRIAELPAPKLTEEITAAIHHIANSSR